jgi:hypothetical protein
VCYVLPVKEKECERSILLVLENKLQLIRIVFGSSWQITEFWLQLVGWNCGRMWIFCYLKEVGSTRSHQQSFELGLERSKYFSFKTDLGSVCVFRMHPERNALCA